MACGSWSEASASETFLGGEGGVEAIQHVMEGCRPFLKFAAATRR